MDKTRSNSSLNTDEKQVSTSSSSDLAKAASPELTGGAGFTFEDGVTAVYAVALLAETTAPGLPARVVKSLSVQQAALGHPLDDVIVEGVGADGDSARLSLQVKRKLVVSQAESNKDFRDTIKQAHATLSGPEFQLGKDRVGAVTGEIADSSKRDFETLCEWARSDSDTTSFLAKIHADGVAGGKERQFEDVRAILEDRVPADKLDADTHALLSHFVLIRMEMLHEGSTDEAQAVTNLSHVLCPEEAHRADDLWRRLLALVRVAEGHAASFDRKTLVSRLNGAFAFSGSPFLKADISKITNESKLAAAEIVDKIAGINIPRDKYVLEASEALSRSAFVQIGGLPGAGKSVVLRAHVERALSKGAVFFIKADRLSGATWGHYATNIGLSGSPLEDLLVEISATGTSTLYIDGLDRVEVKNQGVLLDIFNTILDSPLLSGWSVLTTVRDTGLEPIRTWLPRGLFEEGARLIDIEAFDDQEAEILAAERPDLRPLLFGSMSVRSVARRPFFAGILAKRSSSEKQVPDSELELATAWWAGGGYGASTARAGYRCNALVQLAQAGATHLGRRIPMLGIDPQALAELEEDGIIRQVRAGHTVCFVHDIYFEWAFLQLLVSKAELWVDAIRNVGEPPVLGRVVELLSQAELKEGSDWTAHLLALEASSEIRTQWLRAWMLGPFGLPTFSEYESQYSEVMLADNAKRVTRLAVWFQAEKTKANPSALNEDIFPDLDLATRLVYADALAHPSDISVWGRFCDWLLKHVEDLPVTARPEILDVFELWLTALMKLPNRVSLSILNLIHRWLVDIDERTNTGRFPRDYGEWGPLKSRALEQLEARLREMLLVAGLTYPDPVKGYLSHLQRQEKLPKDIFEQVLRHSSALSKACAGQLVDFVIHNMLTPLPEQVESRTSQGLYGSDFGHHSWEELSIDDAFIFFPSAPTREPFHSLFEVAPDEARRLVNQVTNHAIESWKQLHVYSRVNRGTPIPLTLIFPWGEQTFWGTAKEYAWVRYSGQPYVVGSALMALESWAFDQLDEGRPADDVVRDVLQGNKSAGVLGVACAVMLEARCFSETTLPLYTSQRIWAWDLQRYVSDQTHSGGLMGFQSHDKKHYQAVVGLNDRWCRKTEVRSFASVCVVAGGGLGERASEFITAFPEQLPFDYEEEKEDAARVAYLERTACIWAEVGKRSNYRAEPIEDGSKILVHMDNPQAQGADIDEISRRNDEMAEHFGLIGWVLKYFDKDTLEGGMQLDEAICRARQLDFPLLFEDAYPHVKSEFNRQGAVAGVAAVVLSLGEASQNDLEWAYDVCIRAWRTPEFPDGSFFRGSLLLHHPVLFASYGCRAMLCCEHWQQEAQRILVQLAGHRYEQIAIAALDGLLLGWSDRPEAGWLGLELAFSLSMIQRLPYFTEPEDRELAEQEAVEEAVKRALGRIGGKSETVFPLPDMPAAWITRAEDRLTRRRPYGNRVPANWEHGTIDIDTSLLSKVLEKIPVEKVLLDVCRKSLFLSWCDDLVGWTVERLSPSWSHDPEEDAYVAEATELFEWRRILFRFLAEISSYLEPEDCPLRFIEPVLKCDDEIFASFAGAYVSYHTCNIMDEAEFPKGSLQQLELIVPKLVGFDAWKRASWNDGKLYDSDLSHMVNDMFFVQIVDAKGAARFANGDWSDIESVLQLTDPILETNGQNPAVVDAFLTRCERAFDQYPIDHFVTQLKSVLGNGEGKPVGWGRTRLPARLAGLIQRFSERVQPLPHETAVELLAALDRLVDMGDRRASAVQISEVFKDVRIA